MVPLVLTLKTRFWLNEAMYTLPLLSTATPYGLWRFASMAGMPLGPPPIAVVIMSCPSAGRLTSSAVSRKKTDVVKRRMKFSPRRMSLFLFGQLEPAADPALLVDQRAAADLRPLLPSLSVAVLEQDHQVRLRRRRIPLAEF